MLFTRAGEAHSCRGSSHDAVSLGPSTGRRRDSPVSFHHHCDSRAMGHPEMLCHSCSKEDADRKGPPTYSGCE
jgi:hypothetical protein